MVKTFSQNQIDDSIIIERIAGRKQKISAILANKEEMKGKYESSLNVCNTELKNIRNKIEVLRKSRQDKLVDNIPTHEIDNEINECMSQKILLEDKIEGLQRRVSELESSLNTIEELRFENEKDEKLLLDNEANRLKDEYNECAKILSTTVKQLWVVSTKLQEKRATGMFGEAETAVFNNFGISIDQLNSIMHEIPMFTDGGMYKNGCEQKIIKERFFWHRKAWQENPSNLELV